MTRLKTPATSADRDVDPLASLARDEPRRAQEHDREVREEQPDRRTRTASGRRGPALAAPPTAAISSTWVPVSAPTPWIMPMPNAVRWPYELISSGSTCSWPWNRAWNRRQRVADAVEDEHPAAAQSERLAGAGVAVDRVEDPEPEADQRDADDPAHDRVQPIGQQRAERQRRDARGRSTTAPWPSAYSVPSRIGLDLLARQRSRPSGPRSRRARASPPPGPASWARSLGRCRRDRGGAPSGRRAARCAPPRRRRRPRSCS